MTCKEKLRKNSNKTKIITNKSKLNFKLKLQKMVKKTRNDLFNMSGKFR